MKRTYVVTGAASGIGKALSERLEGEGHRVIGVDLKHTEVISDLSTPAGRSEAISSILKAAEGNIDAVAAVAGIAHPIPAAGAINYFGAVELLEGLRPALSKSSAPRAAIVSSFAAIWPTDDSLLQAMLAGDAQAAEAIADGLVRDNPEGQAPIYPTSKYAVAKWVRDHAPTPLWAGEGIALNAIAPGAVDTPLMSATLKSDEGRAAISQLIPSPLNGPAPASAPAALLAWLLGAENTHVTGQIIFIDGGAEAISRPQQI